MAAAVPSDEALSTTQISPQQSAREKSSSTESMAANIRSRTFQATNTTASRGGVLSEFMSLYTSEKPAQDIEQGDHSRCRGQIPPRYLWTQIPIEVNACHLKRCQQSSELAFVGRREALPLIRSHYIRALGSSIQLQDSI